MSCTIDVNMTLQKAEAIVLQMKACKSLPQSIQEILGLEGNGEKFENGEDKNSDSTPSTPDMGRASIQLKAVGDNSSGAKAITNGTGSGSGTTVTTPDDSEIEILSTDNMDLVL